MASVYRKRKKGNFRISYFQGGKRITRSLKTNDPKIARELKKKLEVELAQGLLNRTPQISVDIFYEEYKKDCQFRAPSTNAREFYEVKKFLEFVGRKNISDITQEDIRHYLARYESKSPKTYNGARISLKRFFRPAIERGYIAKHPCDGIRNQKVPQALPHFFTDEEFAKIEQEAVKVIDSCVYPMILTARYTGLRLGELLALEWQDFDWKNKVVKVLNKPFHLVKNRLCRVVPISDDLRERLLSYIKPSGICFSKRKGGRFEHEGPRRDLRKIFRAVGIPAKDRKGWHEFRHTFASRLAQEGARLEDIMVWMGHSSMQVTLIYAHFAPRYNPAIEKLARKSPVVNPPKNDPAPLTPAQTFIVS